MTSDVWEVKVTSPDGSEIVKLVTDKMIELNCAFIGLNKFAAAAALAVYDIATLLPMEVPNGTDSERTPDEHHGSGAGQDQAGG